MKTQRGYISLNLRAILLISILSTISIVVSIVLLKYNDEDCVEFSNKALPMEDVDKFGIKKIYQTVPNGREWYSKWNNCHARIWDSSSNDYYDSEFFTKNEGNGSWKTDGRGILKISGDTPRMYVIDRDQIENWHNVEITIYGLRKLDDNIQWGGIMAYSRTNHITDTNYCDTRGYGGRFRYDGSIDFEKETKHNAPKGYSQVANKTYWLVGMPKNVWIGYKFVVYDMADGNVKLETYIDNTDGYNGGNWTKINEFTDNGSNFGVGNDACNVGIDPALRLTLSDIRNGSETGKPNLAAYFRSDGVGIDGLWYKKASVREIVAK